MIGVPLQCWKVVWQAGGLLHLVNPFQGLRDHWVFKPCGGHWLPLRSMCRQNIPSPTKFTPPMMGNLLCWRHLEVLWVNEMGAKSFETFISSSCVKTWTSLFVKTWTSLFESSIFEAFLDFAVRYFQCLSNHVLQLHFWL